MGMNCSVLRSMTTATNPWQPMPPSASEPVGMLVLVLWGQPEQK